MSKIDENIKANYAPLMAVLLVVAAFFIGRLSAQVEALKGAKTDTTAQQQVQQNGQPQAPTVTLDQVKDLFKKDLVKFGDANRKVLFVEISDPSCPFCHIAAGKNKALSESRPDFKLVADGGSYRAPVMEMKKLVDEGKASMVWIYSNGHGNGEMAAKALFCANEKGKYWQAHDLLYSDAGYDLINNTVKNDKTKSGDLATFLKNAVDSNFMKSCLDSGKYDSRLSEDMQIASTLGTSGTPNFFVNTTNFVGAQNFADMESTVNAALK